MRDRSSGGDDGRMANELLHLSNQIADAVDAIVPSVVQVHGRRRPASGVVYGPGLVVTTTRALGQEDGLQVRGHDGSVFAAELAGWDPATGLVLLRADGLTAPAPRPTSNAVRVGHIVLAIARSWSNAPTATSGIVSVIGGPLPTGPGRAIERVIRTTAAMHGGFAGGALVDVEGNLVGIATAAAIRGLAVVIPADIAWSVAARLAEHGTVPRGYLGVAGQAVRLAQGQRAATDRDRGVLVVSVMPGSPAEAGGILVGDVLVTFHGHTIESPVDLLELLQAERVGESVEVQLMRGGVSQAVTVVIAAKAGH
jgi:S1-C subfamily serine protease